MRYCFLLTLVQLGGGFELKGTAHRHALSLGHGQVGWEDQASYYAHHDRCDLGTTETIKLMIKPGQYSLNNCDAPGKNSFRDKSHIPNNLAIPGAHGKEWCVEYFKQLGFTPGQSLEYTRKAICDPNTYTQKTTTTATQTTTTISKPVGWEDQASYYAHHDRCDLGTTETIKLMIKPGQYSLNNCDAPGKNSFRDKSHIPNNLAVPGAHGKEWCVEYFKQLGFTPGQSLEYTKKAICDPNTYTHTATTTPMVAIVHTTPTTTQATIEATSTMSKLDYPSTPLLAVTVVTVPVVGALTTTTTTTTDPRGFSGEFQSGLTMELSSMFGIGDNTNVFCNTRCQRARFEKLLSLTS